MYNIITAIGNAKVVFSTNLGYLPFETDLIIIPYYLHPFSVLVLYLLKLEQKVILQWQHYSVKHMSMVGGGNFEKIRFLIFHPTRFYLCYHK